ncbi:g2918 [Coccomyxa elongata]
MVSGTCKTTFTLQPRTINIPSAIPAAGVIWASERFSGVEVLRLSPIGALELAEACSKVLSVDDANGSDEESDDEIEDLDEEEEEDL